MRLMSPKSSPPKTPVNGKNLKQGTLFSFFNKKPEKSLATSPPLIKTSTAATPVSCQTSFVTPSNDDSDPLPSSSKKSRNSNPQTWEKISIGMRIAVYWKEDGKYYEAKVTGRKNNNLKSEFSLEYDNGETEHIDLATEKFRFIDDDEPPEKKRRIIANDESEEEFEFQEEDDDDEAEAKEWVKEDNREEDWMVTDDEDELQVKPKIKANKTKSQKSIKVVPVELSHTPSPKKSESSITEISPKKSYQSLPIAVNKADNNQSIAYVDKEVNPAGAHVHNHLEFLRNPKDNKGRARDHPGYDPRTLKVNYTELESHLGGKISPGVQQWWDIKAQYFDTVLLFKTGKFYEMFHMDADIGVQLLDFCYMKGKVAHAGFPEVSYGYFADRLVRAGYKVARVEQTETPEMLADRKKKTTGKKPQVVNREVCSILTLGTRTFCYLDDIRSLESDEGSSVRPLLAIKETPMSESEDGPVCEYGITLVDAARAVITIGQFADDILRSRMNTLLTSFEPSEILLESGDNGASDVLLSLINAYQSKCRGPLVIEKVPSSTTFPKSTALCADIRRKLQRNGEEVKPWDNIETLDELHRKSYFPRASRLNQESKGTERWPKVLHAVIEGGADLALSSFGAVLFHLQRNLIDQEILRMGTVKAYIPPKAPEALDLPLLESLVDGDDLDTAPSTALASPSPQNRQIAAEQVDSMGPEEEVNHMSLDGTTLHNLEILTNTSTFTSSGSLWSRVNYTKTPHGSRLLRAWLLRPLFRKADIDRRADAVEELLSENVNAALGEARQVLAKCGDIDRLLSRVHSMSGFEPQAEFGGCHPNERAVLYESATHTKRKVGDFSKLLNGLRQTTRIPEIFGGLSISSGLLRKLVCSTSNGGCFPEMEHELDWFFQNFDCDLASKGLFEPSRGVDQEYDDVCDAIERIRTELECYKEEMCSQVLRGSSRTHWKYINIKDDSKDKYLIELPASIRVPEDFIVKGKRGSGPKQVNKYRTGVVESLVQELESALDIHKEGKARGMQLIFAKFASMRKLWAAAAQTTSMLDALGSLAEASSRPGFTRPTILTCPPNTKPCIHIIKGQHPCVEITHNGGQFIPNDLTLGEYTCNGSNRRNGERVLLLSGPNMGGKSTLLRQTCLISILAQIGCYVPAEECALTPIDRIFTRLGACDRILLGQSTFFVELAEMATALRGATRRSLVIMDELGRGTSTFDGTAIASACVKHLVENNQCLTLFATHYHTLLTEWQHQPTVRLGHMECYVENEDNWSTKEKSEKEQNITFLYTLGCGPCPQSFGVNVAKLAGLPNEVLLRARQKSLKFEKELTSFSDNIDSLQADDLCEKLATAIRNEDANAVTDIAEYLENISPTH